MLKNLIEFIFGSALFINALIFIPQAIRIFKEKNSQGVSKLTFIGFLLIQFVVVLHGIINNDYILVVGYTLSMLTCGLVVLLTLIYKRENRLGNNVNAEEILEQLPIHIYWKSKDGFTLGCNRKNWSDFGGKSLGDFIGKTDYELFSQEDADRVRAADEQVMNSGKVGIFEEKWTDKGVIKAIYLSHKAPLRDKHNEIIGSVGASVDITESKKEIMEKLTTLENIIGIMPGHVYWMNTDGIYLGCNDNQAKSIGFSSRHEIIGKSNKEIRGFLIPEVLDPVNTEVMNRGKTIITEEPGVLPDGTKAIFLSTKTPFYNSSHRVLGMVGISIDITDRKNAEILKLQNERQKARLAEQENFHKVVDQVVHDIRSPLASLLMILKSSEKDIPEKVRISLREAAIGVGDIANNLLCKYENKETHHLSAMEEQQPVILSLALLQLLSEKKHQYKKLPVKFSSDFCQECNFTFIKTEPSHFKRMISNIINNAVDSLDEKEGKVNLGLDMDDKFVKIIVRDNGKGMPQEVIDKIMDNIAVTADKKHGHGIGFVQIRETLQRNNGEFEINSKIGKGTEITLTFPRISPPEWFAKEIKLNLGDTVVVLDDDKSIHSAWTTRFENYKNDINLKHFTSGEKTVDFINNFPKKEKILLLTDFELLKQDLNGIHVIERTDTKRSILVTSHYTNLTIRDLAIKNNIKLLPKPLASEVSIVIEEIVKQNESDAIYGNLSEDSASNKNKNDIKRGRNEKSYKVEERITKNTQISDKPDKVITANIHRKGDLVLIDDNEIFVDSLVTSLENKGRVIDTYYKPKEFLDKLSQYAKSTKIFLDNDFQSKTSGLELAKWLHEKGYTQLYLLSGREFKKGEIPDYLTAIIKTDIDRIYELIK